MEGTWKGKSGPVGMGNIETERKEHEMMDVLARNVCE